MNSKREALDTLAPGDRMCWHAGAGYSAWGTVTSIKELHYVDGWNGPVFTGVTVVLDCAHYPTFDSWGWPKDEPRIVTRRFNRFGSDVQDAYTPAATVQAEQDKRAAESRARLARYARGDVGYRLLG
jgi:hypothetical protein